jgi:hypothetical protein
MSVCYGKRDDRVHGFPKQSDPSHVFGMRPWALFLYQQKSAPRKQVAKVFDSHLAPSRL